MKEIFYRINIRNTSSKKNVNFMMTTSTQFTEIFSSTIMAILVYMMYIKFFTRRFADFTFIGNLSSNLYVTPQFVSSSPQIMILTFERLLAFSRAKRRLSLLAYIFCIDLVTNFASQWNSWLLFSTKMKAFSTAKLGFFFIFHKWKKFFRTSLTNFMNSRSFFHIKEIYAN